MNVDVEKKIVAILNLLQENEEPIGARVLAQKLHERGVDLCERTVRYHLKIMDERGYTQRVGRDGRIILQKGIMETRNALVSQKVGMVSAKMDTLSYLTTLDLNTNNGNVVMNLSLVPEGHLKEVKTIFSEIFKARLCISQKVKFLKAGEHFETTLIPKNKIGIATVCGATLNGIFLRNAIPVYSRFGGILEMKNGQYTRFVELINYDGTSIDPAEIFLKGKMTDVYKAAKYKEGRVLAGFREVPACAKEQMDNVLKKLNDIQLYGIAGEGAPGQPLYEIEPAAGRMGMVFLGGLNPFAALEEYGIPTQCFAMKGTMEYKDLDDFLEM